VYEDANGNGKRERREKGIAQVTGLYAYWIVPGGGAACHGDLTVAKLDGKYLSMDENIARMASYII
jgi:hypothetical protein